MMHGQKYIKIGECSVSRFIVK